MKIRLPAIRTLRILALAAFATASATALAQSADYRQGYDQGYRDGHAAAQAAQGGGQAPAGERERIAIASARYGNRDGICDARGAIRQIAGWRRHVEFRVTNDLCGDPAPGREKRLSVIYSCGGGPERRAEARENNVISLYCR